MTGNMRNTNSTLGLRDNKTRTNYYGLKSENEKTLLERALLYPDNPEYLVNIDVFLGGQWASITPQLIKNTTESWRTLTVKINHPIERTAAFPRSVIENTWHAITFTPIDHNGCIMTSIDGFQKGTPFAQIKKHYENRFGCVFEGNKPIFNQAINDQ